MTFGPRTIIVSDAHLSATDAGRPQQQAFVDFLRGIDPERTRRLIVLGDLFDFWFEYRHVIFSEYFNVLRAFADLRDRGVELHFVCGNHDFWAGRFLRNELGFSIYHQPVVMDMGGKRVLLAHGDGINANDVGYRVYKKIARAKPVVALFRMLHPDLAMRLGQFVSHGSRRMFAAEDPSQGKEVAPLRAFAKGVLERGEADVVALGHSHYPVVEEMATPSGTGLYLNTGDWMFHRSYATWQDGVFELHAGSAGPTSY
ncbi:MAG TPA: UDP-2,3-diacylglucosamine diphosphatase [Candidatus Hydrogenedentes bacterium]|nr:UDP-2,3-diacylglucosamine diphosphatase [Candidatus Hydrogenedentota bacterium]